MSLMHATAAVHADRKPLLIGIVADELLGVLGRIILGNVVLGRVLENNGTALWTAGAFQFYTGTFDNKGSFTANSDSTLSAYGINPTAVGDNDFNNIGTFTKIGNGTTQFYDSTSAVPFNNSGIVAVQGGKLYVEGGGPHTGSFAVDAGATLALVGTHDFAASSRFSGAGAITTTGNVAFAGQVANGALTALTISSAICRTRAHSSSVKGKGIGCGAS